MKSRGIVIGILTSLLLVTGCSGEGVGNAVSVLSFRFPATEFYTDKMKEYTEDSTIVNVEMKGYDEYRQQLLLILSGDSDSPYDVLYANNELFDQAKNNDWLMPLDDILNEYWDEYNLGDIPEETWNKVRYDGKIYGIPFQQNLQHLFYRSDIFEDYDITPPRTFDELIEVAKRLDKEADVEYPIAMAYESPTGLFTEFSNALYAYGGEWFDDNNQPLFNSEEGLKAVNAMKDLFEFMPSEAVSYTNDDVMVALQQGNIAMTSIWTSRAEAMEDPDISSVVGNIEYAPAVSGEVGGTPASQLAQDSFVIPKNAKADPEVIIKVILEAISEDNMTEASNLALPVRESVINNPEVAKESKQLSAANETVEAGAEPLPDNSFMNIVVEKMGYYLGEALLNKLSPEEALDKAEEEIVAELKSQGHIE